MLLPYSAATQTDNPKNVFALKRVIGLVRSSKRMYWSVG